MKINKAIIHRRNRKKTHKSQVCMNCGEVVHDANFCAVCGQMNSDRRIPLQEFFHTFLQDYFTFDNKFFKSLYLLLFKPGHLTSEYISGRRQRYIFPFRLYLFTTFIFFLTVSMNARLDQNVMLADEPQSVPSEDLIEVIKPYLNTRLPSVQDSITDNLNHHFLIQKKKEKSDVSFKIGNKDSSESKISAYLENKVQQLSDLGDKGQLMFWKELIDQIPKILFVMLPAFALILKLLYLRRKKYFIEHLIFALHFHTLVFFYLIFAILFPEWYIIAGMICAILVHLYLSLKAVYKQHWFKTLIKMHFLLSLYIPLTIPAFIILALLAIVSI